MFASTHSQAKFERLPSRDRQWRKVDEGVGDGEIDYAKIQHGQTTHHPLLALLAPDYSLYIIIDLNQIALAPQAYN